MSETRLTFEYCDQLVEQFEVVVEHPIITSKSAVYYTGVDPWNSLCGSGSTG